MAAARSDLIAAQLEQAWIEPELVVDHDPDDAGAQAGELEAERQAGGGTAGADRDDDVRRLGQ